MALPTLNVPKFKMKLPSDGRTVNYRPFLVKEEKLLLLATETGSQEDIVTAIKNIIGYNRPEIRKPKRRKNKTYSMNKRGQYWFISYYQ